MQSNFSLAASATLTVKTDQDEGSLRLNSIDISTETPGVSDAENWSGKYLQGVEQTIQAYPEDGKYFSGFIVNGVLSKSNPLKLVLAGDTVVEAVYTDTVTYPVTFVGQNGRVIDVQHLQAGESALAPQPPLIQGFAFVGWDGDFTAISGALTVNANYAENPTPTPSVPTLSLGADPSTSAKIDTGAYSALYGKLLYQVREKGRGLEWGELWQDYDAARGIISLRPEREYEVRVRYQGNAAYLPGDPSEATTIRTARIKSSDASLSSLSISAGTLVPSFSSQVVRYTVSVSHTVTNMLITAKPNNAYATLSGGGTKLLQVGTNNFELRVVSENGAVKVYSLVVTRAGQPIVGPSAIDVTSLKLSSGKMTLGIGERARLSWMALPTNTTNSLSFSSSNAKVVTVSKQGTIQAKKRGKAVIRLTASNGMSAQCVITVKKAPSKIILTSTKRTISKGDVMKIGAKLPAQAAGSISWKSSRASVVAVDKQGNIIAKKVGQARITAKTYNGKVATCTITVKKAPTAISLSTRSATSITIKWKKVKGAIGYEIYRASSKYGQYKKVRSVKGASNLSVVNAKLSTGKTYYYKVRAVYLKNNKKSVSLFSAVKGVKAASPSLASQRPRSLPLR
jgi:uncharacterized protein YjdB